MRSCFTYLDSPFFPKPDSYLQDSEQILQQLKIMFQNHFSFYAVYEWPNHARRTDDTITRTDVVKFLQSCKFDLWRQVWEVKLPQNHQWWAHSGFNEDFSNIFSQQVACDFLSAARHVPGSPLYYAAAFGFLPVAELLLQVTDPNIFGGPESYPLLAALDNGHVNVAHLLLQRGANVNVKAGLREDTALHRAIRKKDKTIVQFLLQHKMDLSIQNAQGLPPLHLAVRESAAQSQGDLEMVENLAIGPDVNVRDFRGKTAVQLGASLGSLTLVSTLVTRGADVTLTDVLGYTPLHYAVQSGSMDVVKFLCAEMGYEVNGIDGMNQLTVYIPLVAANVQMAQAIANQFSNDTIFQNILAEIYLEKGQISKAQKWFDHGVLQDERNREILIW